MKTVFMGTPDFAVPSLEKLIEQGCEISAVFTQPDKPKGRGYKLLPPPVKECAEKHGIPVYQPVSMRDGEALEILKGISPDIIIVAAYGKILPIEILNLPKYGCVNIHASLLPAYRGAAPIQWAVLNGEKKSGVTIMQMEEGLDTGDMLAVAETEIGENETTGELFDRLAALGAELLAETLPKLEKGEVAPKKQGDEFTYAPMIKKDICPVDFELSAWEVHNKIRGLSPYPAALTTLAGKRLKLFGSKIGGKVSGKAGEIVSLNPFTVACGDGGSVILTELQLEGGKRMDTETFLRGKKVEIGTLLGE